MKTPKLTKGGEAFDHDHDGKVGGSLPSAKPAVDVATVMPEPVVVPAAVPELPDDKPTSFGIYAERPPELKRYTATYDNSSGGWKYMRRP